MISENTKNLNSATTERFGFSTLLNDVLFPFWLIAISVGDLAITQYQIMWPLKKFRRRKKIVTTLLVKILRI
jgi:hypothetical protein